MLQSTIRVPRTGPVISAAQMTAHEGLVHWVVRQQWLGDVPFPDALHAGRLGLWQALRRYDPTRGTRFSTYAVPAIARAVWRAVDQDRQTRASAGGAVPDRSALDPDERIDQHQVRAALRTLVADLPPRLRQVIVAHYGLDGEPPQTFAAIGQPLGLTRQRIQQLHVEAVLWLAHPAHSRRVRQLLARNTRSDYQRTRARQYRLARLRRTTRRSAEATRSPQASRRSDRGDRGAARRTGS